MGVDTPCPVGMNARRPEGPVRAGFHYQLLRTSNCPAVTRRGAEARSLFKKLVEFFCFSLVGQSLVHPHLSRKNSSPFE